MAFSLLHALVVLMATGSGRGRGHGKTRAPKRSRGEAPSAASDSGSDYEQESVKGKGKEPMSTMKKKGADSPVRSRSGGPVIREDSESGGRSRFGEDAHPISPIRRGLFENRACLAERHVNLDELCRQVPDFGRLLERLPILPLCRYRPKQGFCSDLIREFYMRAVILECDSDTGEFIFETTVRGVTFDITPDVVGANVGMVADSSGPDHTMGTFRSDTHWDVVVNAICKPGTKTNGDYVESKDLKPEYHILSLIICYNILPTMGTKRIRWVRLLLLYFLGHPESARGLNVNLPFLIWEHMTRVVGASNRRELLPYPILITSILEDHGVDITCAKYDHGLGSIDAITLAKSTSTLQTFGHVKGSASDSTPSAPSRQVQHQGSSGAEGVLTLQSLHQDVRTLQERIDQGFKRFDLRFHRLQEATLKFFDFLRCKHDDVVPPATVPSTSHAPTSHTPDDQ